MAPLSQMPLISFDTERLRRFGQAWYYGAVIDGRLKPNRLGPSGEFSFNKLGQLCNLVVANALSIMLGGIPVVQAKSKDLMSSQPDCVEHGEVRIIGGVRPQNFDVSYRPDGVRFAFDSKTLNDTKSVGKNYQNMVNDLATESTTVHTRFPYAIVAFMIMVPLPCLLQSSSIVTSGLIGSLERLARRIGIDGPAHMAEAISLVAWDVDTGEISDVVPGTDSPLRYERFSGLINEAYANRYKGLPPHAG